MESTDDRYIGQQIRLYRTVRGLTQEQLADDVDISRAALGHYETGLRPVDSRQLLYGLAAALHVTVGDLTGHADDKVNPKLAAFHIHASQIEAALMAAGDDETYALRSLDELADDVRTVVDERGEHDFDTAAALLPRLITDLYRHTRSDDQRAQQRAWEYLVGVTLVTAITMKPLAYGSLAWIAARACEEAADHTGQPGDDAAAVYAKSQVMLATATAVPAAQRYVNDGIDRLHETLLASGPGDAEMAGMLHLHAGLTTAALKGDPTSSIETAAALVPRIGDGTRFGLYFSAQNVDVWRMSIANEWREHDQVVKIAERFDPETIAATDRKCRYFIELGRAHALNNDHGQAMSALLRAEHISSQRTIANVNVREVVGHMMRSAKRELTGGKLGQLAHRVGVTA